MLWLLLADSHHDDNHHDDNHHDYSENDLMLFSGFLLVLFFCVFGVWLSAAPQEPQRVIRHTIVLPSKNGHRREIEIEPC
jgi:hypothetical protein